MKTRQIIASLAIPGLMCACLSAEAHLVDTVTIDFQGLSVSAISGKSNVAPIAGGNCAGSGLTGCYVEDDMVVGIVADSSNPAAHVHRGGIVSDRQLSYHSDTSGIYIRVLDGDEFGLFSLDFHAPIDVNENPDTGSGDVWEIVGFNTAVNPNLDTGNGTDYATRVAYQTVANGFDGTLTLNDAFHDIHGFWIHYLGYPQTPADGKSFAMSLDNVTVGPALAAPVPVPAIGAWMLVSGLVGLVSVAGRRSGVVVSGV